MDKITREGSVKSEVLGDGVMPGACLTRHPADKSPIAKLRLTLPRGCRDMLTDTAGG